MITLSSAREREKVLQAQSDPDGYEVRLGLFIEGSRGYEDLSGRFLTGEWGQEETPITLDATLAGNLPRSLQGGHVKLLAEVDGVLVPQVPGVKTAFLPSGSAYSTDLLASSPGSLLNGDDAIKLGSATDYMGLSPEAVAYDVIRRAPYDLSLVDIEPVPGIYLNYAGSTGDSPGFKAQDKLGDVITRLADDVGYVYRDTVYRGLRGGIPIPLGRLQREDFEHTYPASALPDWPQNRPKPVFETRYRAVRVYKENEDGSVAYEAVEEVPYPRGTYSRLPYSGQTLEIAIEDASAEGADNARRRAVAKAVELSRSPYGGEILLPTYSPLVEAADRFRVPETHRDDDGLWDVLWALRIERYKHLYEGGEGAGSLRTQAAYSAVILEEEQVKAPALIVPAGYGARSSGVIKTPAPSVASTFVSWGQADLTFAELTIETYGELN